MAVSSAGNFKRIYLAAAVILIIGLVYQISREQGELTPNQQQQEILESRPQPLDFAADPVVAKANQELARAQKALKSPASNQPEIEASASDSPVSAAWGIGDTSTTPSMSVPAGVSVYEPVSVDMENPDYPEPGEQISVAIPGGEKLTVNVKSSTTNPNGDYTWRGHLDGYGGDEYPVVMTYGGNSVFATVTTPKGSYTLESVNGSGWIYKNPSEFELSNPESNDFLEIPHEH
ncbi:MAG: hypothetical protein AAGC78_13620 [Cellvibrio sp.]|uniref:hypothetical protein n=1 Tax=Cellvibrio sp. TaxID=1965322 RepID=UPI0031ABD9BE